MKHFFLIILMPVFFSACTKKTQTSISRTPSQELGSGTVEPSALRQRLGRLVAEPASDSPLDSSISTLASGENSITFNDRCNNFIRANGEYGMWGQRIIRSMRQVNTAPETPGTYFGSGPNLAMGNHCKSLEHFQSLTQQQQEHVWVTLWATVANDTSECDVAKTEEVGLSQSRNRPLTYDGLFQFPYYTEDRQQMGMENNFCPPHANTSDLRFQTNCAAATLARNSQNSSGSNSWYWRGLNGNGPNGNLWRVLAEHPYCQ